MDTDGDFIWNPALDTTAAFGVVGDTAIIGDWNADGVDEIGVYRPSVRRFFMDTDGDFIWNPAVDTTAAFGVVGDLPIIGNW
jgi:ABC-type taurine transport system substrate-binding protein